MKKRFLFLFIFCGLWSMVCGLSSAFALDKPFDHSTWDQFLKTFVNEQGDVNYAGVKKNPELLEKYLKQLAEVEEFGMWPREERLALWLNAYHAAIIDSVRRHYPIKTLQTVPGIWDSIVVQVEGAGYSLNGIRDYLIFTFRDEKIDTALSCGSKSCPKMRREAYTGPKLEGQLFLATKDFVNDPSRNKIVPGAKKIYLSRILKWYAKDFRLDFGTFENDRNLSQEEYAVMSFVFHYLDEPAKIKYLESGKYKIRYKSFDWSLNEWHPEETKTSESPASR